MSSEFYYPENKTKVAVIGNFNIDLIMGPVKDIPKWGRECVVSHLETRSAGAAGNAAMALKKLGLSPICIGNVGSDRYGKQILSDLQKNGIKTSGIDISRDAHTGISITLIRENGERTFVTFEGHLKFFNENTFIQKEQLVQKTDYVLFVGYFILKGLGFRGANDILKECKRKGKMVLFDPGWDPNNWMLDSTRKELKQLLRNADIFLPNLDEAKALANNDMAKGIAEKLLTFGPRMVIVKMGEKGSLAASKEGIACEEGFSVKAFDTTGAGDCFNAAVIFGLNQKWGINDILRFANAFSAIVVSRKENRFPLPPEVVSFINKRRYS